MGLRTEFEEIIGLEAGQFLDATPGISGVIQPLDGKPQRVIYSGHEQFAVAYEVNGHPFTISAKEKKSFGTVTVTEDEEGRIVIRGQDIDTVMVGETLLVPGSKISPVADTPLLDVVVDARVVSTVVDQGHKVSLKHGAERVFMNGRGGTIDAGDKTIGHVSIYDGGNVTAGEIGTLQAAGKKTGDRINYAIVRVGKGGIRKMYYPSGSEYADITSVGPIRSLVANDRLPVGINDYKVNGQPIAKFIEGFRGPRPSHA